MNARRDDSGKERRVRRGRVLVALRALLLAVTMTAPLTVSAHDARPLSVAILEQSSGVYRVVVRAPPTLEAVNVPRLVWPEPCVVREESSLRAQTGASSLVACRDGLAGLTLGVDYPVYNPSLTTLFRLELASGSTRTAVLPPDELEWTIPAEPTPWTVARDYTALGFKHIWQGPDHLLFVAGLLLLARSGRRIFYAVTGFTAAHSITLSLATLGVVHAPVVMIEVLIALSLLFLAGEVARPRSASFSRRYPITLSFAFGLLHGFGFASALGEIGLPTRELATGLVFFNIGVELGQLAFIAPILGFVAARNLRPHSPSSATDRPLFANVTAVGAYLLGVPAAFWLIERTVVAFTS